MVEPQKLPAHSLPRSTAALDLVDEGEAIADLEDTPEGQRMFELQELIAETPATILPGVAVQLALVVEFGDLRPDEAAVSQDLAALRNMRDTLQRPAGTGVAA